MMPSPLDVLAIAAHRDDVEQTCGGTLLKMAQRGQRTGILDLTRGEMGTRGSAVDRANEAAEAASILRVGWRGALDIPDGRVENTWENRLKVARVVRELRPRVVILPYWKGRHPDHYTASTLGYEACFLAGLKKLELKPRMVFDLLGPVPAKGTTTNEDNIERLLDEVATDTAGTPLSPHRPFKIIYATLYYRVRQPTFVVDITSQFEERFRALMAYKTQFSDQEEGKGIFPAQAEIRLRVEAMARFYGLMAGVTYAEPFLQKEVALVDDLLAIPVKSI